VSGSLHVAVGQIQSRSKSPTSYTAKMILSSFCI
jgi:hypothetical protein